MTATQTIKISELALPLECAGSPEAALREAMRGYGLPANAPITVTKRALDARKRPPQHVYSVAVELDSTGATRLLRRPEVSAYRPLRYASLRLSKPAPGARPVVVGAGPAGLFAAYALAEAGAKPIVLERGRAVEERSRDVSRLYRSGELKADSNVCYGEGGAGTYSDGKLYTRVGDPRVQRVLELFTKHGARADILFVNRPHIGTDKLVKILKSMRHRLLELGAEIHFGAAVERLSVRDGSIRGVELRGSEVIETDRVILATGHSAREMWFELDRHGLPLECRPFAVGFRVEHPQTLIDVARYGEPSRKGVLPAADYSLRYNEGKDPDRRGVWSFCMCPGGVVVTTPTHEGELCINGMSHASRSGRYANSAMVVSVSQSDYEKAGFRGTFSGLEFQRAIERQAYRAGGGRFVAPACRVSDFVARKSSAELPSTSYRRGLVPAELDSLYPESVNAILRRALSRFGRTIPGFVTEDAVLIGVETRTASPIRLPRTDDGEAVGCHGLFPAGEGMGYGGGIVSAAVDGMRAAEHVLRGLGARTEDGATEPCEPR
ncbi:MAG: FAD-dependent oxidoreductase [Myxococcota bacterium]